MYKRQALGTIEPDGREQGVMAGANVVMPNLSPLEVRKKYMLYDNKTVSYTHLDVYKRQGFAAHAYLGGTLWTDSLFDGASFFHHENFHIGFLLD